MVSLSSILLCKDSSTRKKCCTYSIALQNWVIFNLIKSGILCRCTPKKSLQPKFKYNFFQNFFTYTRCTIMLVRLKFASYTIFVFKIKCKTLNYIKVTLKVNKQF